MNPLLIGNWKMQLGLGASVELARQLVGWISENQPRVELVLCPSFTALADVARAIGGSTIELGAQDVFWAEHGAFTGEESAASIREAGAHAVIIGHSERRAMGETDSDVSRKLLATQSQGLMPIVCVGETADDRARQQHEMVVQRQLTTGLRSTPPPGKNQLVCIAYEPVWAVGTGEPADPDQAEEMRALINRTLIDMFPAEVVGESFRVLYGGSVDAQNVRSYVRPDGFQGGLIGGASTRFETFTPLLESAAAGAKG